MNLQIGTNMCHKLRKNRTVADIAWTHSSGVILDNCYVVNVIFIEVRIFALKLKIWEREHSKSIIAID